MAATDAALYSLNAGEISRLALARIDLAKLRIAAEIQSNWLPHVLGPCQMRPGTAFINHTASDAAGALIPFYYDEQTKSLLVLTASTLQIQTNDVFLSRVAVATAVTDGGFADPALAAWTDSDEAGATSAWSAGNLLSLIGTGTNYAWRDQQVVVAGADQNKEHAIRLVVSHGYCSIKIGTVAGNGGYWDLDNLPPGTYSLAFTPPGNFWIRVGAKTTYSSYIDSVQVEGAGTVSLPLPYTTTAHFDTIRYGQSGDVIFVACSGFQQRRIERRSSDSRSWAVALYQVDDGPFRLANTDTISITPSGTTGGCTLTATRDIFKSTHVGGLFKLTHSSQTVSANIAAQNVFTSEIRVSGLASHSGSISSRSFAITITGLSGSGSTVTLQRSIGAPGSWTDVESYTVDTTKNYDDGLDNQIIYYRIGVKTGNYGAGTQVCRLSYAGSSQTGVCRVLTYTSAVQVDVDILSEFGAATATDDWAEGEWSDYRGWPAAVAFHDGRLFWARDIKIWGSVSDAFHSFDEALEGDAGPINRTIAAGGLDGARWLLSLQRLLEGTASHAISIRSSAFDEPLTPTAFVARECDSRGAAKVQAVQIDTIGVYVERNNKRVFELTFDLQAGDYRSRELTRLKQEMCNAGVIDIAVQRQPDTRVWFVLADGTCAVLTYEQDDDVVAWTPATTDGSFERVCVLPGSDEDDVYFIVKRTISASTKRFIEKLGKRSEAQGGTLSKTVDAHLVYSGVATTAIAAAHLAGKQVWAWADGAPVPTAITLDGSGNGVLPSAASNYVVGLGYTAQLKTAKLAYAAEHGTALGMQKRIARVGIVMADVAWKGVRIGRGFSPMTGLPTTYRGKALTAGQVLTAYDAVPASFNGGWDADSRVCIQVSSPYCATLMGLVIQMTANEPEDMPPARERAA